MLFKREILFRLNIDRPVVAVGLVLKWKMYPTFGHCYFKVLHRKRSLTLDIAWPVTAFAFNIKIETSRAAKLVRGFGDTDDKLGTLVRISVNTLYSRFTRERTWRKIYIMSRLTRTCHARPKWCHAITRVTEDACHLRKGGGRSVREGRLVSCTKEWMSHTGRQV